jgi:cell division protein FtsI/penicillin-binding protein 2
MLRRMMKARQTEGKMGLELYLNNYLTGHRTAISSYQVDKNGYTLPGMKVEQCFCSQWQ